MRLRRLIVLAAASAALLVSGCSIENVMFVEEPDSASSTDDVTPIAKVRGQSSTSWSMEPPSELNGVLVEEARRDALEQVPQGQVIIDPVVDMETMQIAMGLATVYSTKVFMEGTVGKTDDPEIQTASDHEADEYAAEDKMLAAREEAASDSTEPMKNMGQDDASAMKKEMEEEKTDSADAMPSISDERMAKDEDGDLKEEDSTSTMKIRDAEPRVSAEGRDKMAKDAEAQEPETEDERAPENIMTLLREEAPAPPPGPPFGSAEYAEACGMQVDIPDSYGLVYVRTSRSVPIQIMSAAAYIQLLKNRCPAVGGGS